MKKAIIVTMALVLMLSLLYSATLVMAQEPQFDMAPKRVTITKSPDVIDGHGTGFIPPPMNLSHLTGQRMPGEQLLAQDVTLPSSFDWRDEDKVTSVKDQGACGSCWAFAALGNIESKMLIDGHATLPDPDYSENDAKECNYWEIHDILGGTSCDGGDYFIVANLLSKKGTVLESCDPYVPSDVACKSTCPKYETLLDWRIICGDSVPDTTVLKTYIHTNGPVYTAMYAGFPEFEDYDGTYTLYYDGPGDPKHAVLIVGWDDSLSHAGGTGGWIVKNSWGTDWGAEGYFTIAYGSASIGMYSSYIYDWQEYDEDGELYYYDECGWTASAGVMSTTCWALCKFIPTADADAQIERVEFWTTDETIDVDVWIYDDFDGSSLSNLLADKLNLSFNEAGYHSVELDTPVPFIAGDNDVFVVVKFCNKSYTFSVPVDVLAPEIETDFTYFSPDGSSGSWEALGQYGADAAIRVRTGCLRGDVDGDGDIDNDDLFELHLMILRGDDPTCRADVNGDGKIDTLDLVQLKLNIIGP